MAHRVRETMREPDPQQLGGEGKTIEMDDTYYGTYYGQAGSHARTPGSSSTSAAG
jgi:hypothetical protein